MRAWIWLLVVAAVAAGLWLLVDRPASERAAGEPASSAGAPARTPPAQLAAPAPRPSGKGPGATPSASAVPAQQAASASAASPGSKPPGSALAGAPQATVWEQRYSGQTSAQMMARVRELHQTVEVEAAALFERERAAGRYRAVPIVRDAQGRPTNPVLTLGATDLIRHVFVVEGRDEWQVVELPRAEHPGLYALWDEKLWLVQRVNELEFVQED